MTSGAVENKRFRILNPVIGTGLFAILYFIAALYYPDGSQFDINSVGFSWSNNYWCNLLNESDCTADSVLLYCNDEFDSARLGDYRSNSEIVREYELTKLKR